MARRVHDPDDVAPELWDDAVHIDSTDELSDRLTPIAERYVDHYDTSFEDVAYRVAGEARDWWPHDRPRTVLWAPDVLNGLLYPENVSIVIEYVEDKWDRCEGWEDSLALIDAATLGTLLLQIGPPKIGHRGTFPSESRVDAPENRAGEDWSQVFDVDVTDLRGPMKRAGELLDVVNVYVERRNLAHDKAVNDVVRTYVEAQAASVAFYEGMNLSWYVYETPPDERYSGRWRDGIDVARWLREVAFTLFEWKLSEHADDVESFMDLWDY